MTTHAIRSVLAATDLSEASYEVLHAAAAIAQRTGAALHVLHVYDFPPNPYLDLLDGTPTFHDRVHSSEIAVDEQLAAALPPGLPAKSREVVIDVPHRAILARALAVSADLIVLGPHRKGGLEQRILGSTADRVVRSAGVPCLVVRSHLNLPLHRVVVPVDLSDPAREALDLALDWGWQLGPRGAPSVGPALDLRVVHVLPAALIGVDSMPAGHARVGPELHRDVAAALGQSAHGTDICVREELLWGKSEAEEIVRYAAEEGAGLLVLATHGRGAVSRALLGSVTSAVARDARACVLLVPPAMWRSWDEGEVPAHLNAGG
ncbi:MAG TPA: universal stress protein [Longimicrobium sp.]|jgi:nucleotide-binding universal stress UspA family protein